MQKIILKRTKNGKLITLSLVFVFLVLWILIGFNRGSADYAYYETLFLRAQQGWEYHAVETGFWMLIKFASSIGLNYSQFLIIYSLIGLLLISSTIVKYTNKTACVLLAYCCYPFLLDVAQIRHFMACAIFIFSIRFLERFSFKNVILYCIFILIAASQQLIAVAFLIFLMVYVSNQKKAIKIAVVMTGMMFILYRYIMNFTLVEKILETRDSTINYTSGITLSQFVLYVIFYSTLLLISLFLSKYSKKDKLMKNVDSNIGMEMLFKVSMYAAIFIPFLLLDFQYTRLFRSCLIPIYIYNINKMECLSKNNRIIIKFVFWLIMIIVSIKLFGPGSGYYDILTKPIFNKNALFK